MPDPLRALILSDGRDGHFNLSLGLLAAASRLRAPITTQIEVKRGAWPGAVLAAWSNSGLGPPRLLNRVYGIDATQLPKADLVVSAGAETLAANIACARLLGAANVFYGSLRAFRPEHFSLVLTSYPANAVRPRHALAFKPSAAAAGVWRAGRSTPDKPPKRIAVLVCGPSGESTYTAADWDALIRLIAALATQGVGVQVSNSRRTPHAVTARLRATLPDALVDVGSPGAPALADILGASDAVLVTDESSSMVSDGVAAGRPVLGLTSMHHALTGNERDYRQYLNQSGWYAATPLQTVTADGALEGLARLSPMTTDPGMALAALLRDRLPSLFP